jgi:hypothetical protein
MSRRKVELTSGMLLILHSNTSVGNMTGKPRKDTVRIQVAFTPVDTPMGPVGLRCPIEESCYWRVSVL